MTTNMLGDIGFRPIAAPDDEKNISGGFCGDLLSWVMSRAQDGCCWFTVMGNINAIAVATLADIAAVVLCHGVRLDADAAKKAEEEGIAVYSTDLSVFDAAALFYDRLKDVE